MKPARSLLTLLLIALVAICLWASLSLSTGSAWLARGVLGLTLALLLLQLALEQLPWLQRFANGAAATRVERRGRSSLNGAVLRALAWIGALPLAIWVLGTGVGAGLYCLAWLRWHSGERWVFSGLFALAVGAAVQLLFGLLLGADLAPGLLPRFMS